MKTRGQGVSYMAWDAQIGRMRLVKPIPPKLLKVTIKKPTTKTPPITTLRELAFRPLWQSAIENILVYNEADGIKHPFAIEQLPFTQEIKGALNRIVQTFTQTPIQPTMSRANIYSVVRNFTTLNILDNTYVVRDNNYSRIFAIKGAITFEEVSDGQLTLASGLFFVHSQEEIRSKVCRSSINEAASLYQILLLYALQNIIEFPNIKQIYCDYVGIRAPALQIWMDIMQQLTLEPTLEPLEV